MKFSTWFQRALSSLPTLTEHYSLFHTKVHDNNFHPPKNLLRKKRISFSSTVFAFLSLYLESSHGIIKKEGFSVENSTGFLYPSLELQYTTVSLFFTVSLKPDVCTSTRFMYPKMVLYFSTLSYKWEYCYITQPEDLYFPPHQKNFTTHSTTFQEYNSFGGKKI